MSLKFAKYFYYCPHFLNIYFYLCIWLHQVLVAACGIEFPDQGSNPGLLHWKQGALATGPPGKSQPFIFAWTTIKRDLSHTVFLQLWGFGHPVQRAGMLVPQPGIKPVPSALGARSLKHWTTREVPIQFFLIFKFIYLITSDLACGMRDLVP